MSTEVPPPAVPIWPAFLAPVLRVLASGEQIKLRDLVARTLDEAEISQLAREELLESGQPRADNRVGWAVTNLGKARFVTRPARGIYEISDAGRSWLAANPAGLASFGEAHRLFAEFWPAKNETRRHSRSEPVPSSAIDDDVDPTEQIETGVGRIRLEVASDLLDRLRAGSPAFFEQAVVDVLLAMGYGGTERRGRSIGGSGDGGVDGVIDQDALGLDQIYVQAKRYAEGNTVGREAIQAFIGALHGVGASRGVFITSSAFTSGAVEYARAIPTRIILIDGSRLVDLMIKHRVGVQVRQVYEVVEVDEDFFE